MAALWDLVCVGCGALERDVACSIFAVPTCPSCGAERRLTDRADYHPFTPYFDFALGVQVDSLADRWRHMRGTIDRDSGQRVGQMDYRDKMSKGDLSARQDRIEQQKQQQERARG
jgi:hypothetical protein